MAALCDLDEEKLQATAKFGIERTYWTTKGWM